MPVLSHLQYARKQGAMEVARFLMTGLMAGGLTLPLIACKASHPQTIAVIPATTGLEMWEAVHTGAERAAQQTGYQIYWNAPTRVDDIDQQIRLVENVIADKDGGLILAPDQYLALMTPVQHALANHIPVVILESPLLSPANPAFSSVLNDEEAAGRLAAARIGQQVRGKGSVAILGFDPNVLGIEDRARAFESVMAHDFPSIPVFEERSEPLGPDETRSRVGELLQLHPQLSAIFALNTNATTAVIAALRDSRKMHPPILVGCDQELDLMAQLRSGQLDSIVAQDTNRMGYEAVHSIARQRRGRRDVDRILVPPLLITRDNIDTAEAQRVLSTNWKARP